MLGAKHRNQRQKARDYVIGRLARHDYDDLADILHKAEVELPWAPSRSTFYGWVREWREARARDESGNWSLASDETGRPDIVLRVIAALVGASKGRLVTLTAAEARWVVCIAQAVPDILRDGTRYRGWEDGHGVDPIGPSWGTIELWEWALNYVDAETAGDHDKLAELDASLAMLYADQGRHFSEAVRD